jgi:hypothetical protein
MRDSANVHQQIQAMCDCYATNDPLKEMSKLPQEANPEQAAIKWLALAVLHGLNNNAEEISIEKTKSGTVKVVAEYRRTELPAPDSSVSEAILSAVKNIIHADSSQGDSTVAFGFRNNSFDLHVRTREEGSDHKVTIKFP